MDSSGFFFNRRMMMSNKYTFFTLSLEKGFRANLGKNPELMKSKDGDPSKDYVDMMLFLVPNGAKEINRQQATQIVNARFPTDCFDQLKETFSCGDYVRINFDRLDFSKSHSMLQLSDNVINYITVYATGITLLSKAKNRPKNGVVIEVATTVEDDARAYREATSGQ
ncbi:MAG: hypothetical protein GY821_12315 [Gammaproteobacteria bacterium]|nr:hypothetical protein [Gammaproteobacteria bacterium]